MWFSYQKESNALSYTLSGASCHLMEGLQGSGSLVSRTLSIVIMQNYLNISVASFQLKCAMQKAHRLLDIPSFECHSRPTP